MAIQDLVNYTVKNLPDVLTPVLDQVILAAGCDPLEDEYLAQEKCSAKWKEAGVVLCSFNLTCDVELIKMEHLSSAYIKDLSQNQDIVNNGDGTYSSGLYTKVKLNKEYLKVNAGTTVDTKICGENISLANVKDEMQISDAIMESVLECTWHLDDGKLIQAVLGDVSTSWSDVTHNISGLGAFDWLSDGVADLYFLFWKDFLKDELNPLVQKEINQALKSVEPYYCG
jgi:hypothetical protein